MHSMVVPKPERPSSLVEEMARALEAVGVRYAFGVFGGGIAPFCKALNESPIQLLHFRHEAGAAFSAIECSLNSGRLVVVAATNGPGLTNLHTGMVAARWEGAKVLFVSGHTPTAQRGRWSFQETTRQGLHGGAFVSGSTLHYADVLEGPEQLGACVSRLAHGIARPDGFVAHIGIPMGVQTAVVEPTAVTASVPSRPPVCDEETLTSIMKLLTGKPFVIWAGFGARHAAREVRALSSLSGAPVMCSPRAKGVFAEDHPRYIGVTGLGGHSCVETYMKGARPEHALVLGSRLGESVSCWSKALVPPGGFVHVDVDADVFGSAYPDARTVAVQAEIRGFLDALVRVWPQSPLLWKSEPVSVRPEWPSRLIARSGLVRPTFLMGMIQRVVVEASCAPIITEAGNAFLFGTHCLSFNEPGRYRVSTGFGSMGQAVGGVVGLALAAGKAIAIVGDGALLMLNEISTAVAYGVDAVWIVLNDARYGMISQGMAAVGWDAFETDLPRTDFVEVARAMGADGVRVDDEPSVAQALELAMQRAGPFVVDVRIDPTEQAPAGNRNESLLNQGANRPAQRS